MSNWTHKGEYTTTTLITKDYDLSEEPPPFLVDGIIHQSITLIYGQTCSGKSTIAASLAVALANGQTKFIGRPIANDGKPLTVGIIVGDPLGQREYARRMVETGAIGHGRVYINEPYRPTRRETWHEVRDAADTHGWDFVIVDNLSSFVPGSLNDDDKVKIFYDEIQGFPRQGIPVLVVAHTSEKTGEHGPSRIPMGSSLIRFGPRWWCYAHRSGDYLHLDFDGNEGEAHKITVTAPDGTPFFDVVSTETADQLSERRRNRSRATLDQRAAIGAYLSAECKGLSQRQAAQRIVEHFPQWKLNVGTVTTYINQGVYPSPEAA